MTLEERLRAKYPFHVWYRTAALYDKSMFGARWNGKTGLWHWFWTWLDGDGVLVCSAPCTLRDRFPTPAIAARLPAPEQLVCVIGQPGVPLVLVRPRWPR